MNNFVIRDLRSLKDVFQKMNYLLTGSQKKIGFIVFFMTIVGAVLETLGVSIIVPLVQSFLDTEQLMKSRYVQPFVRLLHIQKGTELIIWISVAVILIYIFKNIYMILLSYVRIKYAVKVKRELSIKIMNSYMERDYTYFLGINTADILRGVGYDVSGVQEVLSQIFKISAEILTAACICLYIFSTDILMATGVVLLMGISLGALTIVFRNKMKVIGEYYRKCTAKVNQCLYEAFQGIKDVLVFHREKHFSENYRIAFTNQLNADVSRTMAAESPAHIIEAVCISGLIMVVGFKIVIGGNAESFVPQLAAFAVAAFRILPSIGKISAGFNQLIVNCPAMNATYRNLKEVENHKKDNKVKKQTDNIAELKFINSIQVNGINWQYPGSERNVLTNLSMTIAKGKSVALIGQSGAGKSTMADVLLGLLIPEQGDILVDGVSIYGAMDSWKKIVGYVPQTVFLMDDSIRHNIAFGLDDDEIDNQRLMSAVKQAQLETMIGELPNGLDTLVGERGVRFSGGQRQRIAIARALYNNPEVLILDEATAALDNDTENAVMEAIDALHGYKTLIIIAHRLTTIRNCDEIYEVVDGIARQRNKEEIL